MYTRYWIRFDAPFASIPLHMGCGVTAANYDDALALVRAALSPDAALPPVREVTENVDVSGLDVLHVLPNIGDVTSRGVWFPAYNRR